MFEGFTGREILMWAGGVLVAAVLITFGAIWITDAYIEAHDPIAGAGAVTRNRSR
jgi:hypothetical protein